MYKIRIHIHVYIHFVLYIYCHLTPILSMLSKVLQLRSTAPSIVIN